MPDRYEPEPKLKKRKAFIALTKDLEKKKKAAYVAVDEDDTMGVTIPIGRYVPVRQLFISLRQLCFILHYPSTFAGFFQRQAPHCQTQANPVGWSWQREGS